jgi:hypothetical protein
MMMQNGDRARRHTAQSVLRRIDDQTVESLATALQRPAAVDRRLKELDGEWDLDRTIETEAALVGLTGLALGVLVRPAFLAIPATVGAGVFLFGTLGIYPLLPIFRRLGIRTSREIQRERYALKAIRGDFSEVEPQRAPASRAAAADEPSLHH